jgi:uncharacterized circularly permuted ATP-grasp superfamily protein/uncharacterized alpha-E superfamily protein
MIYSNNPLETTNGLITDSLFQSDPLLTPYWNKFLNSFNQLGTEELQSRNLDVNRYLKENGVTYTIHNDPSGSNRPWNLDIIPFLIQEKDWAIIESGLAQRAGLFDMILKDIYGEQKLIKNGIIPMEIVYFHRGFIRECCGIKQAGNHNLVIYSADMAKSKDGSIWVLNDRTQSPSGSGYALENRMAMARIVPELFDQLKIKRLSPFFNEMHSALMRIAPKRNANPRIVILTPGSGNETYFEHSFLSSHLGLTLVQGDDLMVKDNFVWLKTLGGLERVDVIVRRVDDIYCDPLELKEDSQLGVPGLLQAVRSGNVSIANPLGSSVVENPGLIPFLPAIAKYFLGEKLALPTIASWWCGQKSELKYVLENLNNLVIKKIYREPFSRTSIDASLLASNDMSFLKSKILAQPHLYVAQEKVDFAKTPTYINNQLEAGHALFRSFAVGDGDGYKVMEGGLTRASTDKENIVISNQIGGFSKDTWVLSSKDDINTLNFRKEQEHLSSKHNESYQFKSLPSRNAENLYWIGRYAERVIGNARFQRTIMQYVAEANKAFIDESANIKKCLLESLTQFTFANPGFLGIDKEEKIAEPWDELSDLLFDQFYEGSLAFNLFAFIRSVNSIPDYWSTDTWRVLREMEDSWNAASHSKFKGHYKMLSAVDAVITSMMAFISLNRESISREQGWTLLDTGRKIEQGLLLSTMLRSTLILKQEDNIEYILRETVLKSNENIVNYRYKYRAHLQLPLLLDLMLLDSSNPKSLIYQMERLKAYMNQLPKINQNNFLSEHQRLALEALTTLQLADKDYLSELDPSTNTYTHLEDFLNKISGILSTISETVSKTYFKHAQEEQQQLYR